MAALVVITLANVFSRSAAAVTGSVITVSVITVSSAILLFPSLRLSGLLLLAWLRSFPCRWTRRDAPLHNQPLNIVQFGIQVVQAHLDVSHAFGNRDNFSPGRHGQLLKRSEHRLFDRFAEWSGNRQIGVEHCSRSLRIGFGVYHIHHGLAPSIHIDVAHPSQGV